MPSISKALLMCGATVLLLGSATDLAQARVRHHARGHSVRAQQRVENRSPGVNRQLFPDSKQSATGGQPGGAPGTE